MAAAAWRSSRTSTASLLRAALTRSVRLLTAASVLCQVAASAHCHAGVQSMPHAGLTCKDEAGEAASGSLYSWRQGSPGLERMAAYAERVEYTGARNHRQL